MKLYFDDRNRGGRVKEEKKGVKWSVAPLATFSNTWHPFSASAQAVKHLPTMRETRFDPWVGKISWRRRWHPTPVLSPGKSHGGAW